MKNQKNGALIEPFRLQKQVVQYRFIESKQTNGTLSTKGGD